MQNKKSPVQQDFIWLGEYYDGTHLAEFDFLTKKENNFYDLDRQRLIRFGILGHGMHLYYEVHGGVLKLNGQMVELMYRDGEKEYFLTGRQQMFRDIITYKDAEAFFNPNNGRTVKGNITAFNFGYKEQLQIDGVDFGVKVICTVPFNQPAFLTIRLLAGKEMNGELVVRKNNKEVLTLNAPLRQGVGGEVKWVIK